MKKYRAWMQSVLASSALVQCTTPDPVDIVTPHDKALAEIRRIAGPESQEEAKTAAENFKKFYQNVTRDKVKKLGDVYAEELYFNDTLATIRSREALQKHFMTALDNTDEFTVKVAEIVPGEPAEFYVRWSMIVRYKELQDGMATKTLGISHIRLNKDGKIVFHQDYWDSTAGFFAHIPVLGWLIDKIRP